MQQAYRYTDEKTDKYWWIDYSGTDLAINYGKRGADGAFKVKEYDNEEQCIKSAQKFISQKIKKGYYLDVDFDFLTQYYFDDAEVSLHPKTSHPNYVKAFSDACYYDCSDEYAPFGSDAGHDTLTTLQENVRKNKSKDRPFDFIQFPVKLVEQYWDMPLILPSLALTPEVLKAELAKGSMRGIEIYQSDKVIIATAFGQIKITGKLSAVLKAQALSSFARLKIMEKLEGWDENKTIMQQTKQDLQAFTAE